MRHPDAIPRGVSEGILRASRAPASPSRGDEVPAGGSSEKGLGRVLLYGWRTEKRGGSSRQMC